MTTIVLLILGIQLAVNCDDRDRAVKVRARFDAYRHRLAPIVAAPHDLRYAIRCLRCGASSRLSEEPPRSFPISAGRNERPADRR